MNVKEIAEKIADALWDSDHSIGKHTQPTIESILSAELRWLPLNRDNPSLRWLLMRDTDGVDGIRLGRPEQSGWRLVDERGQSTWQPHHEDFYLAEMPLDVPTDAPLPADQKGEQNSER